MLAYLVIREGAKWTDVFRLVPGQSVTIGRAPTNQVVLKDERCSRHHAELFVCDGQWTLRDLESRNGTAVGEQAVKQDYALSPGDLIRIGSSQLAFVHDLTNAFPDSRGEVSTGGGNGQHGSVGDSSVLTDNEHQPTKITHRQGQTRFLRRTSSDEETEVSRAGRAATMLCRLAFDLAQAPDVDRVANVALDGIFDWSRADTGGLLLFPRHYEGEPDAADLQVIATRAKGRTTYHRVSPFLATTVLREREAVLARNVMGDSKISMRDSDGEIDATSVICAPIRCHDRIYGLLHLYSTDAAQVPDPDDLEFALAVADTAAVALENLSRREELSENLQIARGENLNLREQLGVASEIVGRSTAVRAIADEIRRAAPTKATVLIRGESGVGKELVARAVHYASPRAGGTFVCLNCAALSETLLESELFGHEKGAFTGATGRKIGKFELADKGTIMLDEIGEMSPTTQAKFLRVLEGHPFERVGGSDPVKVDVRVIAATNRDLERDVAENLFRRDLYFRLNVFEIVVPALRKRPEDIPELANHFLRKFVEETGRRIRGFTPEAMDRLRNYRWPGNVRELRNVIERAVLLARRDLIENDDLMLSKLPTAGETSEMSIATGDEYTPFSLTEWEKKHILATLKKTGWNKSQSANILGIERSTLDRKIRRYELEKHRKR